MRKATPKAIATAENAILAMLSHVHRAPMWERGSRGRPSLALFSGRFISHPQYRDACNDGSDDECIQS